MTDKANLARLFRVAKYSLYALLALNVYLFLDQSLAGASHVYRDGVELGEVIVAFTDPIDALAWFVLLMVFELETAVLDKETLTGRTAWALNGVALICYLAILYAWWGYLQATGLAAGFVAHEGRAPCDLAGQVYSVVVSLDEYAPLTAETCAALGPGPLFNPDVQMFASRASHFEMTLLSWLDVANASLWLVVVALLQIEIQLKGSPRGGFSASGRYKAGKGVLYGSLVVIAVAWGVLGDPIDAWDAVLWLVAFLFIELNVFAWQAEARPAGGGQRAGASSRRK